MGTTGEERLTPSLALELRLKKLEHLVGAPAAPNPTATARPALLRALAAKHAIDDVTSAYSSSSSSSSNQSSLAALRSFVQKDFDASRRYLSGGFRGYTPGAEGAEDVGDARATSVLSPQEQVLILLESLQDMRAVEWILVECKELDARGYAGAGKLAEHEAQWSRLNKLQAKLYGQLGHGVATKEQELFRILESYQRQVETASRLFIRWDAALDDMDEQVTRLERQKAATVA